MSCTSAVHAWRALRRLIPALILTLLASLPATAQSHRTAIGVTGGWSTIGDLTPGFLEETVLESGWTAGLQLETWLGSGRFGLRTSGGFTVRDAESGEQYAIGSGDVGILGRFLPARPGRLVAPYGMIGFGGVHYRAPDGGEPIGGGLYGTNPITRAVAVAGLGADLLNSSRFGLRIEASDQIVLLALGESPDAEGMPTAHTFHVTTALQLRLGSLRPRIVATPAGPADAPAGPLDAPRLAADRTPAAPAASAPSDAETARLQQALEAREREIAELERQLAAREGRAEAAPATAPAPARAAPRQPQPAPVAPAEAAQEQAPEPRAARRAASAPLGSPLGTPAPEPASEPAPTPAPERVPAATPGPPATPTADRAANPSPPAGNPASRSAQHGAPLGAPLGTAVAQAPAAPTPAAAPQPARQPARQPAAEPVPQGQYTVQVGSLVEAETAGRWTELLRERRIPVWTTPVSVQGQQFLRVRVGVLSSESEAQGLAGALMRQYGWPVSVDRITAEDRPPVGALNATRSYLYGG